MEIFQEEENTETQTKKITRTKRRRRSLPAKEQNLVDNEKSKLLFTTGYSFSTLLLSPLTVQPLLCLCTPDTAVFFPLSLVFCLLLCAAARLAVCCV